MTGDAVPNEMSRRQVLARSGAVAAQKVFDVLHSSGQLA